MEKKIEITGTEFMDEYRKVHKKAMERAKKRKDKIFKLLKENNIDNKELLNNIDFYISCQEVEEEMKKHYVNGVNLLKVHDLFVGKITEVKIKR